MTFLTFGLVKSVLFYEYVVRTDDHQEFRSGTGVDNNSF